MRLLLNLVWLILAGLWLAIGYLVAAVLLAITIVGLPFSKQAIKLAAYALWPFGRTLVASESRSRGISIVGNILWFVLAGWWLALGHLLTGCVLCLTIIGIPLGIGDFKMAAAALAPFGKRVVRKADDERHRRFRDRHLGGVRRTNTLAQHVDTPNGIRTRAAGVKGRSPRPLDDGGLSAEYRRVARIRRW